MYEFGEKTESYLLVGVQMGSQEEALDSLAELRELARTAGAKVLGTVLQARRSPIQLRMWERESWRAFGSFERDRG